MPSQTQQQLKEIGPDVQVVVMPGVGHWPSKEVPDAYVKLLKDFLSPIGAPKTDRQTSANRPFRQSLDPGKGVTT